MLAVDLDQSFPNITLRLVGELDVGTRQRLSTTVEPLRRALQPEAVLVLDLVELRFCDAAGVVDLVNLVRMAVGHGCGAVVKDPPRMFSVIADALRLELPAGTALRPRSCGPG